MPETLYAPLPLSFEWVYEFPSPMGGVHRKLTPGRWNGSDSKAQYLVYTADQMRAYADATCSLRGGQQGWRPVPEWVYDLVLSGNLEPVLMRAGDEATRLRLYRARQEMLAALPTSTHPQETER